jgi:large subunit ribosomal protein L23
MTREIYYDILRMPVITEKSTILSENGKYVFKVDPKANKALVKKAIESIFNVKVTSVNMINLPSKVKRFRGKLGKRSGVRKAIVTLGDGQTMDLGASI